MRGVYHGMGFGGEKVFYGDNWVSNVTMGGRDRFVC